MRMSTLLEEVRKFSVDEAVSPAQQAAIAISKKERGEKPKNSKEEGNAFGKELKVARDKGDKTFVVSGRTYEVEDYDVQEDGHTDVASAQNNVKVAMSALTKMSGELAKLNPEDALPSWWTNKVAVAVDKLDGMADYLDTQVEALDTEDEPKVKEIIKKLKGASKAHAGQADDLEKAVKEEVELDEVTMSQALDIDPKDVARMKTLAVLYTRAMKLPSGSPKQDKFKKEIEKLRKELRMDESVFQELVKSIELDEMKMNDPKLLKVFDKLKKGDKIKLKTSSTISKGKDFVEYIVKSKNTVNKGRVEKITLATVGNEGAVKKFLYKRDGTVGFAIGDMGASIDDIKEDTNMETYISRISVDEKRKLTPSQRAQKDARRAIAKDPDIGNAAAMRKAQASKDKDKSKRPTHLAPDSAKEQNVMQQMKTAINMRGQKDVEFEDGKKSKVPAGIAQKVLKVNDTLKPKEKREFQRTIAKSYKDLLSAIKGK